MATPPQQPPGKTAVGSLRSLVSITLFVVLVALVSYLSLRFVLAVIDRLT